MKSDLEIALEKFKERKAANASRERIDNSRLPAGSPMHYYCRFCGDATETLPECHLSQPITCCDPCHFLHQRGLI